MSEFAAWLSGAGLDAALLPRWDAFVEALYSHNEAKNLTRIPREQAWVRHGVDSLLFHDLFPEGAKVLDVGTGPGFPAWPLALFRPDLELTALDSNGKMLAFLESQPLPNLRVAHARAEEFRGGGFDVATGRALAPLPIQLEVSVRPVKLDGWVLPMRTPLDPAPRTWPSLNLTLESVVDRNLPGGTGSRRVPMYRKTAATPPGIPRAWAEIKRRPAAPR